MDDLVRRGRTLLAALTARDVAGSTAVETRIWQHDCEAAIRQLSGGSKSHWLSRAYSEALLVRSDGRARERADLAVIVERILGVLNRAGVALAHLRETGASPAADGPVTTRFDFVHDADLRPVLEEAYVDGRRALDDRRYEEALLSFCGILEAVMTDALLYQNAGAKGDVVRLSFDERIAAAEQIGLIRNGCARLPAIARRYREVPPGQVVREDDARRTGQVLRTVMRDLDPGR